MSSDNFMCRHEAIQLCDALGKHFKHRQIAAMQNTTQPRLETHSYLAHIEPEYGPKEPLGKKLGQTVGVTA